ncbi:choice-of-anchor D domain-containing protein [Granulosicoccaceae sp. 1_MG-2023]|nr:choice-of-anchor D domain-containing protein [Granulosicoccaceae sp. 1_MG-2023]
MRQHRTRFLLAPLTIAMALAAPQQSLAKIVSIPLNGTAVINNVTNMSVTPPLLQLGDIRVGESGEQTITISNRGSTGDSPITILPELTGADSSEFMVERPASTEIQPGESIDVNVTFSPVTTGDKSASLEINQTGASGEYIVFLKGVGAEQAASNLVAASSNFSLGETEMGVATQKTITLSSEGDADGPLITLEENSISISGDNADDFSADMDTQVILEPGGSYNLPVTLYSETYGDKSATMTIRHDGTNDNVKIELSGEVINPELLVEEETPEFTNGTLSGVTLTRPTKVQFGPDGKLYVTQMNGMIHVLTVKRTGKAAYEVTDSESIDLIYNIPNHDDDGTLNNTIKGRLLTGLFVTGTAEQPVLYMASGDPRQGAGPSGTDKNLDTNSVILSKITKQDGQWVKTDLVRGLPRSEENHQGNGLVLDQTGTKIFLSMGGNTNMGAPSNNFARLPEVALSAAIIEIDLENLPTIPYDLPTLDDEDRAGVNDANDPFGGNNGKNQAKLVDGGPVQIYSPGYRNAYDLVLTEAGRLYTIDNGPNVNWGGVPVGDCSNDLDDTGNTRQDGFHYISHKGYYGGHPNPTRGNKSNTFNETNPQTPIEGDENSVECTYLWPGKADQSLTTFVNSTNGIAEYTASNFSGAMKGDLLAVSYDRAMYRLELNSSGDTLLKKSKLINESGTVPLDVTAQGDNDIFPGTIWIADWSKNAITVYEPNDY